jgi:hypothetical protein
MGVVWWVQPQSLDVDVDALEYVIVVLEYVIVVLEYVIVVLDGVVVVLDVLEYVIVVMDVLEYVMGVVDEVVMGVMIGLIVVLREVLEAFEMDLVEVGSGTQPGRTVEEPL